ncbi:tyrosine-type recombinase/integrase [[Mycobacterium] manitobense]|uniref:tyrosine-type recombinase/integrase n=1 Tax=[Mycobacterium] manitobense TaxID=190147 RepID=UPI0021F39E1F|nr:site-specific integrase [[Mycobacterium] manitobense]
MLGTSATTDGSARRACRKTDAQQWLNKQVSDQVTGTWTDPALSAVTFGAVAERWFATKATRAPKTVAGYRSLLDTVILPRWAQVPLRDVLFVDLQAWVTSLSVNGSSRFEGKGLSASRVIQAHQVVSQVLKYAVRGKYLPSNPADSLELPRKPETEQRYLTHEQLHRLAMAAGRFRTFILVLGYCGLRFGEAAALRVRDVDLERGRIRVRRSVTHVTGQGLVEGPTKNHAARAVPVLKRFLAPLLATEIEGRSADELVFPSRRGGYLTEGELRWMFDPAATAIGQQGLVPHELRHTCATMAIAAGANIKVLQKLMGHKTATLTWDRYGHLYPDDLDAVAAAFDDAAETTADDLRTVSDVRRQASGLRGL